MPIASLCRFNNKEISEATKYELLQKPLELPKVPFMMTPTARLNYVQQGHFEAHLYQFCKTAWDTNKLFTETEI